MPKLLVINADDFAMTNPISSGIADLCRRQVVTSVSIIATTPALESSLELIRDLDIDTGIHLTLNAGRPLSMHKNHPAFVDRDGDFWKTPMHNPWLYLMASRPMQSTIHDEFKMQIELLRCHGIKLTHLDSHFHIHLFPALAPVIKDLMREYHIPYMRRPIGRSFLFDLRQPLYGFITCSSYLCFRHEQINSLSLYGFREAGRLNEESLKKIFNEMDIPAAELIVHPGLESSDNSHFYSVIPMHLKREFDALTSLATQKCLSRFDIKSVRRQEIFNRL
ncbi:MAG: ChbG/HpnK family deacetylase [Candidatus Omnitrophica bacterium]|nr:ChbG/HpnK family deacetylase [Candidatus Omnitrophota bacterium]